MILAGDVGGTKTNLGWFRAEGTRLTPVIETSVRTADYPGLDAVVAQFITQHRYPAEGACFGLAAPVIDGRSEATNLPWPVDVRALRRLLGCDAVWAINDMEATGYGIEALPDGACATLQAGQPKPQGTIAVIAAGTSLGEATLVWDQHGYRAMPSEGGHADFAPRTALELELCRALIEQFGHVSYARILSGPGLMSLYRFLKATGRGEEPEWLRAALSVGDPSAVIAEHALTGPAYATASAGKRSALCEHALSLFVSCYGAEAGNLALRTLPRGGVYLGGGIAPKILPKLSDGTFMRAFTEKGRLSSLLATMPVRVILDDRMALYGAARHGRDLLNAG